MWFLFDSVTKLKLSECHGNTQFWEDPGLWMSLGSSEWAWLPQGHHLGIFTCSLLHKHYSTLTPSLVSARMIFWENFHCESLFLFCKKLMTLKTIYSQCEILAFIDLTFNILNICIYDIFSWIANNDPIIWNLRSEFWVLLAWWLGIN